MDQSLLPIAISYLMIGLLSKDEHVYSLAVQDEKVVCLQAESGNRRLPELVALMPVADELGVQVDDNHVESVDTHGLKADSHERCLMLKE